VQLLTRQGLPRRPSVQQPGQSGRGVEYDHRLSRPRSTPRRSRARQCPNREARRSTRDRQRDERRRQLSNRNRTNRGAVTIRESLKPAHDVFGDIPQVQSCVQVYTPAEGNPPRYPTEPWHWLPASPLRRFGAIGRDNSGHRSHDGGTATAAWSKQPATGAGIRRFQPWVRHTTSCPGRTGSAH
jgi:hypothetical protein